MSGQGASGFDPTAIVRKRQILNHHCNRQTEWSYMTSAAFGSPCVLVSCCKTISRSAVTAEAAGSSPVVPAIHSKQLVKAFSPHCGSDSDSTCEDPRISA